MANQQAILATGVGLFGAAFGQQFLTELSATVDAGTTEEQLTDFLAVHPVFTDDIMGDKTTTALQVEELMNHYMITPDDVVGSAATQAEAFFTDSIDADVPFGAIIWQATTFLLSDSVPDEFAETANMLKAKIEAAENYSAINTSTDLATLQQGLLDEFTGGNIAILTPEVQDIILLDTPSVSQITDTNGDGLHTINGDPGFLKFIGFETGPEDTADRIDVTEANLTNFLADIVNVSTKITSRDDNITSIPDLFDDDGVDRGVAYVEFPVPGDIGYTQTFVMVDGDGDGDFNASDDIIIGLLGAGPITTTELIFG